MSSASRSGLPRYSRIAILLHWVIALLVITNIILVKQAGDVAGPARSALMGPHTAIGITILALSLVLLLWRLTHPRPPLPTSLASWERWLSRGVHVLFYLLIIGLPIGGWMMVSDPGEVAIDWFGLIDIPALPVSETLGKIAHDGHVIGGNLMIGLIALHILGALKHQLLDKMPYFHRMWPG